MLIRTNNSGQVSWAKKYGGNQIESCRFIKNANNGNLIIGGLTTSFGAGGEDALLFEIDPSTGDLIWQHTYGLDESDAFQDLASIENGYIAVGRSRSFNSENTSDALVLKLFENGGGFHTCMTDNFSLQVEPMNVTEEIISNIWEVWDKEIDTPNFIAKSQNVTVLVEDDCIVDPVFEAFKDATINVYPNPATEEINFVAENLLLPEMELMVTNALGQQIAQMTIGLNSKILVRDWSKGVYFYLLKSKQGELIGTGKFIVQGF